MRVAAARGKVPELRVQQRNAAAEREALEAAAGWLCRFTPSVSLEPTDAIVMEVEGSLKACGGQEGLARRAQQGVLQLGFQASMGTGRTARAALWRALSGELRLPRVPVAAIAGPEDLQFLHGIGVRRIGDLAKVRREGIARRISPQLLTAFDQAAGRMPEPRAFFMPPVRFSAKLALPTDVTEAPPVLFAAQRLLNQLEGFLAARHAGVHEFVLRLMHRHAPRPTLIRIGLAGASRDVRHFTSLLRERLDKAMLSHPVDAIALEAGEQSSLPGRNADFLGGGQGAHEEWLRLLERLQARLGKEGICGLSAREDYRPEQAWREVEPGTAVAPALKHAKPRPLWLVDPRALKEEDFVLLKGPERIESGWWDGKPVSRDYFVAQLHDGSLAWIYRDLRDLRWYLHGIFA